MRMASLLTECVRRGEVHGLPSCESGHEPKQQAASQQPAFSSSYYRFLSHRQSVPSVAFTPHARPRGLVQRRVSGTDYLKHCGIIARLSGSASKTSQNFTQFATICGQTDRRFPTRTGAHKRDSPSTDGTSEARRHCLRRVHACARETLEVVLARRLPCDWC